MNALNMKEGTNCDDNDSESIFSSDNRNSKKCFQLFWTKFQEKTVYILVAMLTYWGWIVYIVQM